MTTITADAISLNHLLWNLTLFCSKVGAADGKALLWITDGWMYGYATDDFVAIRDRVAVKASDDEVRCAVRLADLKTLESNSRTLGEGSIELTLEGSSLKVLEREIQIEDPGEVWVELTQLVETEWDAGAVAWDWYINPDRLKNIPRLKIDGDHAVGMRPVHDEDAVMISFIYGPSVKGVISSMDESVLKARGVHLFGTEIPDPEWDQDEPDPPLVEHYEREEHLTQGVKAKDFKPTSAIGTRVVYTEAVDVTVAPDHCDKEAFEEYGF